MTSRTRSPSWNRKRPASYGSCLNRAPSTRPAMTTQPSCEDWQRLRSECDELTTKRPASFDVSLNHISDTLELVLDWQCLRSDSECDELNIERPALFSVNFYRTSVILELRLDWQCLRSESECHELNTKRPASFDVRFNHTSVILLSLIHI